MPGRILILGAPGSGKGTQARRIAKKHGLPHISTGDIFRGHIEQHTDFGKRIEKYMTSGSLVPDSLACEIVVQRLLDEDCNNGYILDGFPRSVPQAEELERVLIDRNELLDVALVLEVDAEELVERLSARRTCPECGTIYNLKFYPPKEDEQCDNQECNGAKLVQRDDDQETTIRKRLHVYHETTEPMIEYYSRKGLRKSVGGSNMTPDEVAAKIEDILMAEKAS